jgi:hypothetical protein
MRMEQLRLDSLLAPPQRPIVVLDATTVEAVVTFMADAIATVFAAGGADANDEPCAEP